MSAKRNEYGFYVVEKDGTRERRISPIYVAEAAALEFFGIAKKADPRRNICVTSNVGLRSLERARRGGGIA
jgi:hypothetical protein